MQSTSSPKLNSFYVIHGFMGGKLHSRNLEQALKSRGYLPAANLQSADIIISHSGGHILLPGNTKAKLIVLIGAALPQENPKSIFLSSNYRIWRDARREGHAKRNVLWNLGSIAYGLCQPKRNYSIMRQVMIGKRLPQDIPRAQIVFIANKHDKWPKGAKLQYLVDKMSWAFLSMPGAHGHLWEHPADYIAIIDYYAKLLAQAD